MLHDILYQADPLFADQSILYIAIDIYKYVHARRFLKHIGVTRSSYNSFMQLGKGMAGAMYPGFCSPQSPEG